jgi:hypothetical protein
VYHAYSEGVRFSQLISCYKGVVFKNLEGEISQGVSGPQIFLSLYWTRNKQVFKRHKHPAKHLLPAALYAFMPFANRATAANAQNRTPACMHHFALPLRSAATTSHTARFKRAPRTA